MSSETQEQINERLTRGVADNAAGIGNLVATIATLHRIGATNYIGLKSTVPTSGANGDWFIFTGSTGSGHTHNHAYVRLGSAWEDAGEPFPSGVDAASLAYVNAKNDFSEPNWRVIDANDNNVSHVTELYKNLKGAHSKGDDISDLKTTGYGDSVIHYLKYTGLSEIGLGGNGAFSRESVITIPASKQTTMLHRVASNISGSDWSAGIDLKSNSYNSDGTLARAGHIVLMGDLIPHNTTFSVGSSASPYTNAYLANAPIIISDNRAKQDVAPIDDAVLDAWGDVELRQFLFKDAVTRKGADVARIHAGVIAQQVISAFAAHGLDATRYGVVCHDTWEAKDAELDENGNVLYPAREAGDRYSIRYSEAMMLEAAYQRRRMARIEARLSELEARQNAAGGE